MKRRTEQGVEKGLRASVFSLSGPSPSTCKCSPNLIFLGFYGDLITSAWLGEYCDLGTYKHLQIKQEKSFLLQGGVSKASKNFVREEGNQSGEQTAWGAEINRK